MNNLRLAIATLAIMFTSTTANYAQISRFQDIQFGIISPIGTNGQFSTQSVNKVSINLLGDYSYGNTLFEFSGLHNSNLGYTKGVQLSGLINYTGKALLATQISGLANIAKQGASSSQIGGILNMTETLYGAQIGGVSNITNIKVTGAQIVAGINVANNVEGAQVAGGANITKYNIRGAQVAGGMNISKNVSGSQIAGGINIARHISGTQIGLINFAKRSDGVSIGLINIIIHNGKQEFEISHSEALDVALSFKLGTDKFYTIFSAGVGNLNTSTPQYAVGFGAGTHISWNKGWGSQVEVITYALTEDGNYHHYRDGINQLNQLKYTISKQFAKRFKIFAGPVFNFTFSDYVNPETNRLGTSLTDMVMWTRNYEQFKIDAWIGFTAGVRF